MERVQSMKRFSNQVDELFNLLEGLFARVKSRDGLIRIKTYKNKFTIFKRSNIRMIIGGFWEAIQPFKEHIEQRDEKFFLENDLDSLGLHPRDEGLVEEDATKLKHIWNDPNVTDKDKESIWELVESMVQDARVVCA